MRRRWLLWLLGGGACFLSACATVTPVVRRCAPAEEHFVDLASDALDADTCDAALAGLTSLAEQTAVCVVRDALGQLFDFALKAQAAPNHRQEWAAAWLAAHP